MPRRTGDLARSEARRIVEPSLTNLYLRRSEGGFKHISRTCKEETRRKEKKDKEKGS
ncbi:MAG: hypothetical protein QXX84_00030 [Sulfolobales archaeon]